MRAAEARKLFPHIAEGKIYFNHASTGPLFTSAITTLERQIFEKTSGEIDAYEDFLKTSAETKQLLGRLINCSPDNLAFVDNTTNGLNILAKGLSWDKDDEIILNDLEFPANVYPFLNLESEGVKVKFVKSDNGQVTAESIIDAVTEKTKLISVSFVQFLTGYKVDLEILGNYCREKNIIFCVDAIQGLGALRLDVTKSGINFLSCGSQKWLLGLTGLGFVYVDDNLLSSLHPAYAGWLSVENAWDLLDFRLVYRKNAERFQPGTLNMFGIYALRESLKLLEQVGYDDVEEAVLSNSRYLIEKLTENGFDPVLKNTDTKGLSGIVSFKHPKAEEIFKFLKERNIHTAVREGLVRLSPHFYNNHEDINKVINALTGFGKR